MGVKVEKFNVTDHGLLFTVHHSGHPDDEFGAGGTTVAAKDTG